MRAWMQHNIGPPVQGAFGATIIAISTSHIYVRYIAPTLNAFLIGMVAMIPLAWFWHRNVYNALRQRAYKSAKREVGEPQVFVEPVSTSVQQTSRKEQAEVKKEIVEQKPTPEPQPEAKQEATA